jgi:hypothetical protein
LLGLSWLNRRRITPSHCQSSDRNSFKILT